MNSELTVFEKVPQSKYIMKYMITTNQKLI